MAKRTLEKPREYDPYSPRTLETPKQRETREDLDRRNRELEKIRLQSKARRSERDLF